MGRLSDAGCVTRIMGSNALSLASVGAGRALATMIGEFGPVDCHAGTLIAQEAGAAVRFEGKSVICASPGVVDELVEGGQEQGFAHRWTSFSRLRRSATCALCKVAETVPRAMPRIAAISS
jgi:hypothetical protein